MVVLLHAFMGSALGVVQRRAVHAGHPRPARRALRLAVRRRSSPCSPTGCTALGGSQWIDSPGNGAYGQMLVQDVLGHVDRTYATLLPRRTRRRGRAAPAGTATWQLMRRFPDVFGHIASHSADAYFEYCYLTEFPKAASAARPRGGVRAVVERVRAADPRDDGWAATTMRW